MARRGSGRPKLASFHKNPAPKQIKETSVHMPKMTVHAPRAQGTSMAHGGGAGRSIQAVHTEWHPGSTRIGGAINHSSPVRFARSNFGNSDLFGNRVDRSSIIQTRPSEWVEHNGQGTTIGAPRNPIGAGPGAWEGISGLQEPAVLRTFEGVNMMNPFAIKETQAMRANNFSTAEYPALSVRTGGNFMPNPPSTALVQMVAVYNSEIHVIAGGTWYKYAGGSWTTLHTGIDASTSCSYIVFQGSFSSLNLIVSPFGSLPLRYDGTSVTTLGTPTVASCFCTHDNRVYYANTQTVYFSALRKADDWTTVNDAGTITVETPNGGSVTGLIAGSQRLVVLFNQSIYELYGDGPSNYQLKLVTDNLGCPTSNAAQVIDGWMYFLGNDAIYRYSGGFIPDCTFALPVKNIVETINRPYAYNSVSWYKDRKFYLAIPTGTNQRPDTVLEYDIEFNTWNVHSYTHKPTSCGVRYQGNVYVGFDNGNVEILDFQTTNDGGTAISYEWVSKPFGFASLASRSRWFRVWMVADVPVGSTMDVYVSPSDDEEDWVQVQSISSDQDFQAQEIVVPANLIAFTNTIRIRVAGTGPVNIYEISRQERTFPMGNL